MKLNGIAIALLLIITASAWAQTSTTYALPTMVCNSSPENCYYEIANEAQSGVFMATTGYNMQFQYRAFPGQNPGYDAEYCVALGSWSVADTPNLGPTAKLFTMDCQSHNLINQPSSIHAEVFARSFNVDYPCGTRIRTTCHATRWQIDAGSTVTITKPVQ